MKQTLKLHGQSFRSASNKTPQYLEYHKTFKREFTKTLKSLGCSDIKISRPNHFDVTGFFRAPDGQIWYFSISDLRWSKDRMLLRTAEHFTDYTGGGNQFVSIDDDLISNIERIIS